jgi:hypothetical protein
MSPLSFFLILFLDVTGFLEMPLNDQMRLLQTSWPEVLTLSLAFRSIPLNSTNPKLQWSADFGMNEKEARECGMEELFFQVGGSIRSNLFLCARTTYIRDIPRKRKKLKIKYRFFSRSACK